MPDGAGGETVVAYVGLGSNLGDRLGHLAAGVRGLAAAPQVHLAGVSSIYESAPVDAPPQPDFLNAALLVEVDVAPLALLAICQRLETAAGRDRGAGARFGPRVLDIDLLLAPDLVVEGAALTLPHPRLAERRFALLPACELVPDWVHPRRHRTVAELAATVSPAEQPCRRVGSLPAAGEHR